LKYKVGECPNPLNGKKSALQVLRKNAICDEDILPPKGSGYKK